MGKCPACGTQLIVKCICQNYQCTICNKSVAGRAGDGGYELITKVGGLVRRFCVKTGLVHHFKDNYITRFRIFSFCTRWSPIIDTVPMARSRSHCSRRSCIPCLLCNRTGGGCSGECVPPGGASPSTRKSSMWAVLTQTVSLAPGANRMQVRKPRPCLLHLLHPGTRPVR